MNRLSITFELVKYFLLCEIFDRNRNNYFLFNYSYFIKIFNRVVKKLFLLKSVVTTESQCILNLKSIILLILYFYVCNYLKNKH